MMKALSDWVSDQIVEFARPIAHRIADDITDELEVVVTVKVRMKGEQ